MQIMVWDQIYLRGNTVFTKALPMYQFAGYHQNRYLTPSIILQQMFGMAYVFKKTQD